MRTGTALLTVLAVVGVARCRAPLSRDRTQGQAPTACTQLRGRPRRTRLVFSSAEPHASSWPGFVPKEEMWVGYLRAFRPAGHRNVVSPRPSSGCESRRAAGSLGWRGSAELWIRRSFPIAAKQDDSGHYEHLVSKTGKTSATGDDSGEPAALPNVPLPAGAHFNRSSLSVTSAPVLASWSPELSDGALLFTFGTEEEAGAAAKVRKSCLLAVPYASAPNSQGNSRGIIVVNSHFQESSLNLLAGCA